MLFALDLAINDYEDAVQISQAIGSGLDAIVTRDIRDFRNSPIRAYTPAEFLELFSNPQR